MIICPVPQRKFSEFYHSLGETTAQQRIPFMGVLELTYRCNLSCRHCYCNLPVNDQRKDEEMNYQEITRVIDEMVESGCLWLLLTGGESLLRSDFWDIYLYAKEKGLLVEIFTNATFITEEVAKKLAQFPPLGIEISVYGSNPKVNDCITRTEGSFERALAGMKNLLAQKIGFELKTMLITCNEHDLENIKKLAQDLKVDFKFDYLICPRNDKNTSPLQYRLPVEKVVDLEFATAADYQAYKELFAAFWKKGLNNCTCAAGQNAFNINPYGILSPCTMFSGFQYSLKKMPFKEAWQNLIHDYGKGIFASARCRECTMISMCASCPAWAELETGRLDGRPQYLCEYTLLLEKKFFEEVKEEEYAQETVSKT